MLSQTNPHIVTRSVTIKLKALLRHEGYSLTVIDAEISLYEPVSKVALYRTFSCRVFSSKLGITLSFSVAERANSDIKLKKLQILGSCHKRQKPQAPTPQAPIRNRQTRKVANAKGLNRNTNLA